jgi:pre-mRNA-splicing factor CWC26
MPLADYLAQKYLTASPAPNSSGKKRKRKQAKDSSSGLIIADDDALGWTSQPTELDEEEGRPLTLGTGSAEFRKAKKNTWKTVGVPAPKDAEQDAADRIISQAAAENSAAGHEDEAPVVEDEMEDSGVVKMGDGTHAGLQSGAAVKAQFEKRKREEREAWEREQGKHGKVPKETVYRDATGRRIDISMRRAEAKKELDEKARKEREEKEMQKGDVQRVERKRRREELDEARFMPVARKIDDVDMNAELKERDRWNDPAAQFLSQKEKGKSASGKPLYRGAAAPNRYGIRPGHKWDGVDRGNGWEAERFKAMNRALRNKDLEYTWQMDE